VYKELTEKFLQKFVKDAGLSKHRSGSEVDHNEILEEKEREGYYPNELDEEMQEYKYGNKLDKNLYPYVQPNTYGAHYNASDPFNGYDNIWNATYPSTFAPEYNPKSHFESPYYEYPDKNETSWWNMPQMALLQKNGQKPTIQQLRVLAIKKVQSLVQA